MGVEASTPRSSGRNAAKLALDGGRSVREVARELGVNHESGWRYTAAPSVELAAGWRPVGRQRRLIAATTLSSNLSPAGARAAVQGAQLTPSRLGTSCGSAERCAADRANPGRRRPAERDLRDGASLRGDAPSPSGMSTPARPQAQADFWNPQGRTAQMSPGRGRAAALTADGARGGQGGVVR